MKKRVLSIMVLCFVLISTMYVPAVVMAEEATPAVETLFDLDALLENVNDGTYTGTNLNNAINNANVSASNKDGSNYIIATDNGVRTMNVANDSDSNSSEGQSLTFKNLNYESGKYRLYTSLKLNSTIAPNQSSRLFKVVAGDESTAVIINMTATGISRFSGVSGATNLSSSKENTIAFSNYTLGSTWVNLYCEFSRDSASEPWYIKIGDVDYPDSGYFYGEIGAGKNITAIDVFGFWTKTFDLTVKNVKLVKINSSDMDALISFTDKSGAALDGNTYNAEPVEAKVNLSNSDEINPVTARVYAARYNSNGSLADVKYEDVEVSAGGNKEHTVDLSSWTMGKYIYKPTATEGSALTATQAQENYVGAGATATFGTTNDKARYDISADGEIKAYLSEGVAQGTSLKLKLDETITDGSVSIYAKFKRDADSSIQRQLLKIGTLGYAAKFGSETKLLSRDGYSNFITTGSYYTSHEMVTDDDGYVSVCCKIEKISSGFKITVTDEYNNHDIVATAETTDTTISDITLFSTWPESGKASVAANAATYVKDIKIVNNNAQASYSKEKISVFVWSADGKCTPFCPAGIITYDAMKGAGDL